MSSTNNKTQNSHLKLRFWRFYYKWKIKANWFDDYSFRTSTSDRRLQQWTCFNLENQSSSRKLRAKTCFDHKASFKFHSFYLDFSWRESSIYCISWRNCKNMENIWWFTNKEAYWVNNKRNMKLREELLNTRYFSSNINRVVKIRQ